MKKFKFQTTTDVFVQCKIRACAQQPCGVCSGTGHHYRELQDGVDLSPGEGEMYSPPVSLRVAPNDMNALVFPDMVPQFQPQAVAGPQQSLGAATQNNAPPTTKPIMVKSNLVLSSVSASWAIQNREAVTETLRSTMGLSPSEDLVITSISRLGRELEQKRQLQTGGGVKIDFVVGVSSEARAQIASSKVSQLASGSPAMAMQFSQALDSELQRRGQPAVRLPANSMAFAAPTKENNSFRPAGQSSQQQVYAASSIGYQGNQVQQPAPADEGSDNMILGLVIGAFAMGIMGVVMFLQMSKKESAAGEWKEEEWKEETPDVYASKVAALEQNWQAQPEIEGMDQSAW
jgi:hypothetical protein